MRLFALLAGSAAAAAAEPVAITVGGRLATMRPGFVSFSVDFDNRPSQLQAGFYSVNFSDTRLRAMAAALSPAALRVGGGDEDKQVYAVGDYAPKSATADYDPWSVRNTSARNLMLVTPERYAALAAFAKSAGLRLIWAFNIFYGVCCDSAFGGKCPPHNCTCAHPAPAGKSRCYPCHGGTCRAFDSSNAEAMLAHMKATNAVPWAVQLGNEGGNGIAPLSGATSARAFMELDDAIRRVWKGNTDSAPIIMGPDGGNPDGYLTDFWSTLRQAKRESLLAAFSYHTYGQATNGGTGHAGLRNATVLSSQYAASYWQRNLAQKFTFNKPSSQTQVSCHDIAGNHLGCILLKMPAISLLAGLDRRVGLARRRRHPLRLKCVRQLVLLPRFAWGNCGGEPLRLPAPRSDRRRLRAGRRLRNGREVGGVQPQGLQESHAAGHVQAES